MYTHVPEPRTWRPPVHSEPLNDDTVLSADPKIADPVDGAVTGAEKQARTEDQVADGRDSMTVRRLTPVGRRTFRADRVGERTTPGSVPLG